MSLIHAGYPVGAVDISSHQHPVDFPKLYNRINAIVIRAGDTYLTDRPKGKDLRFDEYWRTAQQYRLPRASYWYWRPDSTPDMMAEYYLDALGFEQGEMGLYLDLEEKTINRVLQQPTLANKAKFTANIAKTLLLLDAGVRAIHHKLCDIYTSPGFWNSYVDYTKIPRLSERRIWIATWPTTMPFTKPGYTLNGVGNRWEWWQFSRKGGLPDNAPLGIGKQMGVGSFGLDTDVFFGSVAQFEQMFKVKPKVLPASVLPLAVKPVVTGVQLRPKPSETAFPILATTSTNPIEIMATGYDERERTWYQIGKGLWIPGWYVTPVFE